MHQCCLDCNASVMGKDRYVFAPKPGASTAGAGRVTSTDDLHSSEEEGKSHDGNPS